MRLPVVLVIATLVIVIAVAASAVPDQSAEAKFVRKVHFTDTVESSPDPGVGRGGEQMAVLLSPNPGTIYVGTLTYAASEPVEVMVLHELEDGDAAGQPIWTVDGNTKYAVTLLEPSRSGSIDFAGAALALHTERKSFDATASVDGWIRGEPVDIVRQTVLVSTADREPELKLARTVLPATLPMHKGLYNGGDVYYVITDAGTEKASKEISEWQEYDATTAPSLKNAPASALGKVYLFKNGVKGDGIYGYQKEIFSGTPEQPGYGSLRTAVVAEWNKGQKTSVMESEDDLLENVEKGRIVLDDSGPILNIPQVKWPDGAMPQGLNLTLADYEKSPYGTGSQILSMDEDAMTVTFVSHREWMADGGSTSYCIPVATTPSRLAGTMGVVNAPASASLANSDAASDYYEFKNGITGSGQLGFQPSVRNGTSDGGYSPIQKVSIVEWVNPADAQILETREDIRAAHAAESVTIIQARPLNSNHVINCPAVIPDMPEPSVMMPPAGNKTQANGSQTGVQ